MDPGTCIHNGSQLVGIRNPVNWKFGIQRGHQHLEFSLKVFESLRNLRSGDAKGAANPHLDIFHSWLTAECADIARVGYTQLP